MMQGAQVGPENIIPAAKRNVTEPLHVLRGLTSRLIRNCAMSLQNGL